MAKIAIGWADDEWQFDIYHLWDPDPSSDDDYTAYTDLTPEEINAYFATLQEMKSWDLRLRKLYNIAEAENIAARRLKHEADTEIRERAELARLFEKYGAP